MRSRRGSRISRCRGCRAVTPTPRARNGRGPAVVAYVLGTEQDPQDRARQERTLADVGCIIAPTGARAALLAAAIAARRPEVAGEAP
ncbi:MAG: hypothetical protein ACRDRJ_37095 [Streptosporangiaceae bacterium]